MDSAEEESQAFAHLGESLCNDPDVDFAVVFGSRTSGDEQSSSDIDVAVKFSDALTVHERFQKRCFLAGNLQRTDEPFVDVSDIEELPLEVAHDAVTGSVLCGDEQAFREYRTAVESEFDDRRDEIRERQRDVIERIAEGGLHG